MVQITTSAARNMRASTSDKRRVRSGHQRAKNATVTHVFNCLLEAPYLGTVDTALISALHVVFDTLGEGTL